MFKKNSLCNSLTIILLVGDLKGRVCMLYNLLIVNVPVKRQNTKKEPGVGEGWGGEGEEEHILYNLSTAQIPAKR